MSAHRSDWVAGVLKPRPVPSLPMNRAFSISMSLLLAMAAACATEGPAAPPQASPPMSDVTGDATSASDVHEDVPGDAPPGDGSSTPDAKGTDVEPDTAAVDAVASEVATSDSATTDTFTPSDGACETDCADKTCGSDGCGGICGYCTYPLVCDALGLCVEVCEPQCAGRVCGPDGCGGQCSPGCDEDLACGENGLCYEVACEPDCTNKVCGEDGCGGDCGLCASPKVCVSGGCALGPCGIIDAVGECQGEVAVTCADLVTLVEDDCDLYEDLTCAYDGWANKFACIDIGPCVPQCEGKVCGADGCEGTCGSCTNGWSCELGQCKPEPGGDCGSITVTGKCEEAVLIFCSADKIYMVDCAVTGETCKWNAPENAFGCL
jgi:hypothetical protein